MCGRYYIAAEDADQQIADLIDVINRREKERSGKQVRTGDVFPTDDALVIANSRRLTPGPFLMKWGFSTEKGGLIINARSESAAEKPMFRELLPHRRLIIPASGYYEWEKNGKEKTKYALTLQEKVMYMTGLYRPDASGERMEFVILTRDAAPGISFIHSRMPVIFSKEDAYRWLKPDADPVQMLERAIDDIQFKRAV